MFDKEINDDKKMNYDIKNKDSIIDDEIDLGELFLTIIKRKNILIICTIIFFLLGLVYSLKYLSKYEVNFYAKSGIAKFFKDEIGNAQKLNSIEFIELKEWFDNGLYAEKNTKNYGIDISQNQGSNVIELKALADDTKECILYIESIIDKIKNSNKFNFTFIQGKKNMEDSLNKLKNSLILTENNYNHFSDSVTEVENTILFENAQAKILKSKVEEKEKTLKKYRFLYEINIKERNDLENNLKKSVDNSSSISYLLYSNLLQHNLSSNSELTKNINIYENEIRDLQVKNAEIEKKVKGLEINKNRLKNIEKLKLEKNIENLKSNITYLEQNIKNLSIFEKEIEIKIRKNPKVKKYILFSIIFGIILGFVGIILVESYEILKKRKIDL